MANRWGIPPDLEKEIRDRDRECIYCRSSFGGKGDPAATQASWEHIINDASIITRDNIALCCRGCNASKGQKSLSVWLQSRYCRDRNINQNTIAEIAAASLED